MYHAKTFFSSKAEDADNGELRVSANSHDNFGAIGLSIKVYKGESIRNMTSYLTLTRGSAIKLRDFLTKILGEK